MPIWQVAWRMYAPPFTPRVERGSPEHTGPGRVDCVAGHRPHERYTPVWSAGARSLPGLAGWIVWLGDRPEYRRRCVAFAQLVRQLQGCASPPLAVVSADF